MILAGDIGATKTALALFEVIAGSPLRLARHDRACFGVAVPVEEDGSR